MKMLGMGGGLDFSEETGFRYTLLTAHGAQRFREVIEISPCIRLWSFWFHSSKKPKPFDSKTFSDGKLHSKQAIQIV